MAKLDNPKYELFCQYYCTVIDGKIYNAHKAALEAGYSKKTARQQGSRLLSNVDILKRIEEIKAETIQQLGLDRLYFLTKLKSIVEDDIKNYMSWKTIKYFEKNDKGEDIPYQYIQVTAENTDDINTWNVQEVSKGKDGFKIKLHSKEKAMKDLIEYLKVFEVKVEDSIAPVIIVDDLPEED